MTASDAGRGLRHLGTVESINSTVMLVLGDVLVARRWQGIDNAEDDRSGKGSDWERCFRALHGDHGSRQSALVACGAGELLAFRIDSGGRVDVYRDGESLVLVEVAYTDLGDIRQSAGFLGYVGGPFSEAAAEADLVVVDSGAIAILPSPLPGTGADEALTAAAPPDGIRLPISEEGRAECGLALRLPAGQYRVRLDQPVEHAWGGACRARIEPCPTGNG
jgi:hypothetical protein